MNLIVKSEKKSQRPVVLLIWFFVLLFLLINMVVAFIDYSKYREGQEFALEVVALGDEATGSHTINKSSSYEEQCRSAYDYLSRTGSYYGSYSWEIDRTMNSVRESFANIMELEGYDRYSKYTIAEWFRYTNSIDYFKFYYNEHIFPKFCLPLILLAMLGTVFIVAETQKELEVYDDSVICKTSIKQSKQILYQDINSVDYNGNSIKLSGSGINFRISNLSNAESIKTVLTRQRKDTSNKKTESKSEGVTNGAAEILQYKTLLDSGIITEEEFENKKKQILNSN